MPVSGFHKPGLLGGCHRVPGYEDFHAASLAGIDFIIIYIALVKVLVLRDEGLNLNLELVLTDHAYGRENARHNEQDHDGCHQCPGPLSRLGVLKFHLIEFQILDHYVCGKDNENAVDEEQVQGSEEIVQGPGCDSVSRGAERRHKGRGNGYT